MPGWDIGDWGGGVDSLNLRNARAVFMTAYGGEASFRIQMLDVSDVQTWRPDQPGTFSFRGDVNGIAVSAEGRAWPFADPARAEGEIAINDVSLENIEQYTGSLNFEKRAGRLSLSSSLLASLDPERHLRLGGEGVLKLADVDVARADLGRVTMWSGAVQGRLHARPGRRDPGGRHAGGQHRPKRAVYAGRPRHRLRGAQSAA